MPAEFDLYAAQYEADHARNIAITGEAPDYFAHYKVRVAAGLVRAAGTRVRDLLDFGAGIGNSVPHFRDQFPGTRIVLSDPSRESLEIAARRFPGPEVPAVIDDGGMLPFGADAFDLCFAACVFHHIAHDRHAHWLGELRRVTRPGGIAVVFEHNPLNPLTRHAVNTCPFDANAVLVGAGALRRRMQAAGWEGVRVRFHVFFPAALAPLRRLDGLLGRVPLGAQYAAWARKA